MSDFAADIDKCHRYGRSSDSDLETMLKRLHNDEHTREGTYSDSDLVFRGVLADKLDELDRPHEAALLRDRQPVRVKGAGWKEDAKPADWEVVPDYQRFAWPGGGEIVYLAEGRNGGEFCADCMNQIANDRAESLAANEEPNEMHPARSKLYPYVHEEGPPIECANCNRQIPALYGDPENPDEN